jgi:alpha-tubulin suppressor-like RCC1 family protein
MSAGEGTTCAVLTDGSAWCWGGSKLGTDELAIAGRPVRVALSRPVRSVAVGGCHACALAQDGTGWCWGLGTEGQLGNGVHQDSTIPVQVSGLSDILELDAGG